MEVTLFSNEVVIGLGIALAEFSRVVVTDVALVAARVYQHLLIFKPDFGQSRVFLHESCISVMFLALVLLMIMSDRVVSQLRKSNFHSIS